MPGADGTGPAGFGPMTGRGAGFCSGYLWPAYMNSGPGIWQGYGRLIPYPQYPLPVSYRTWGGPGLGRRLGHAFFRGFGFGRSRGRRRWVW